MSNGFKKVAFTCYPVQDLKRARAFYEETLGLTPGENFQDAWQEYDLGGTTFAISTMVHDAMKPGSQASIAFEVENLTELVQKLTTRSVKFHDEGIMESPVCHIAFCKDPDGNSISLHQLK